MKYGMIWLILCLCYNNAAVADVANENDAKSLDGFKRDYYAIAYQDDVDLLNKRSIREIILLHKNILQHDPKAPVAYLAIMDIYPMFVSMYENLHPNGQSEALYRVVKNGMDDKGGGDIADKMMLVRTIQSYRMINELRKKRNNGLQVSKKMDLFDLRDCDDQGILRDILADRQLAQYHALATILSLVSSGVNKESKDVKAPIGFLSAELPYYDFMMQVEELNKKIAEHPMMSEQYQDLVMKKFELAMGCEIEKMAFWKNPIPRNTAHEAIQQMLNCETKISMVTRLLTRLNDENDPPDRRPYRTSCYYSLARMYKDEHDIVKMKECIAKGRAITKDKDMLNAFAQLELPVESDLKIKASNH